MDKRDARQLDSLMDVWAAALLLRNAKNSSEENVAIQYLVREYILAPSAHASMSGAWRIKTPLPPNEVISAVIECGMSSEDTRVREKSFRLFQFLYATRGGSPFRWGEVRSAVLTELGTASVESASSLSAALGILSKLTDPHLVAFLLSKEGASIIKTCGCVAQPPPLCRIAIPAIGKLLLRAWLAVMTEDTRMGLQLESLCRFESYTDVKRAKEDIADIILEVFRGFSGYVVGDRAIIQAASNVINNGEGSGSSGAVDSDYYNVITSDACCSALVEVMEMYLSSFDKVEEWVTSLTATGGKEGPGGGRWRANTQGVGYPPTLSAIADSRSPTLSPLIHSIFSVLSSDIYLLITRWKQWPSPTAVFNKSVTTCHNSTGNNLGRLISRLLFLVLVHLPSNSSSDVIFKVTNTSLSPFGDHDPDDTRASRSSVNVRISEWVSEWIGECLITELASPQFDMAAVAIEETIRILGCEIVSGWMLEMIGGMRIDIVGRVIQAVATVLDAAKSSISISKSLSSPFDETCVRLLARAIYLLPFLSSTPSMFTASFTALCSHVVDVGDEVVRTRMIAELVTVLITKKVNVLSLSAVEKLIHSPSAWTSSTTSSSSSPLLLLLLPPHTPPILQSLLQEGSWITKMLIDTNFSTKISTHTPTHSSSPHSYSLAHAAHPAHSQMVNLFRSRFVTSLCRALSHFIPISISNIHSLMQLLKMSLDEQTTYQGTMTASHIDAAKDLQRSISELTSSTTILLQLVTTLSETINLISTALLTLRLFSKALTQWPTHSHIGSCCPQSLTHLLSVCVRALGNAREEERDGEREGGVLDTDKISSLISRAIEVFELSSTSSASSQSSSASSSMITTSLTHSLEALKGDFVDVCENICEWQLEIVPPTLANKLQQWQSLTPLLAHSLAHSLYLIGEVSLDAQVKCANKLVCVLRSLIFPPAYTSSLSTSIKGQLGSNFKPSSRHTNGNSPSPPPSTLQIETLRVCELISHSLLSALPNSSSSSSSSSHSLPASHQEVVGVLADSIRLLIDVATTYFPKHPLTHSLSHTLTHTLTSSSTSSPSTTFSTSHSSSSQSPLQEALFHILTCLTAAIKTHSLSHSISHTLANSLPDRPYNGIATASQGGGGSTDVGLSMNSGGEVNFGAEIREVLRRGSQYSLPLSPDSISSPSSSSSSTSEHIIPQSPTHFRPFTLIHTLTHSLSSTMFLSERTGYQGPSDGEFEYGIFSAEALRLPFSSTSNNPQTQTQQISSPNNASGRLSASEVVALIDDVVGHHSYYPPSFQPPLPLPPQHSTQHPSPIQFPSVSSPSSPSPSYPFPHALGSDGMSSINDALEEQITGSCDPITIFASYKLSHTLSSNTSMAHTLTLTLRCFNSSGFKIPAFSLSVTVNTPHANVLPVNVPPPNLSHSSLPLSCEWSYEQQGDDYFLPDACTVKTFQIEVKHMAVIELNVRVAYPDIAEEELDNEWKEGGKEGGKEGSRESGRGMKKRTPGARTCVCVCSPIVVGIASMLMPYGAGAFTCMRHWRGRRDSHYLFTKNDPGSHIDRHGGMGEKDNIKCFLQRKDNVRIDPTPAGIPLSVFQAQVRRLKYTHKSSIVGWTVQGFNMADYITAITRRSQKIGSLFNVSSRVCMGGREGWRHGDAEEWWVVTGLPHGGKKDLSCEGNFSVCAWSLQSIWGDEVCVIVNALRDGEWKAKSSRGNQHDDDHGHDHDHEMNEMNGMNGMNGEREKWIGVIEIRCGDENVLTAIVNDLDRLVQDLSCGVLCIIPTLVQHSYQLPTFSSLTS